MAAVGEFGLIAEVSRVLPPDPRTLVGIGDDAAVLAAPDGRVVACTDFLLEGRHFRRDWSSAADVGVKAAARSLIDIAAMGAAYRAAGRAGRARRPAGQLGARPDPRSGRGVHPQGASVIGGDTARASSVLLAITGLGDLAGRAPVLRSGAAPGNVVALAGPLGHAAAGLALLSAGITRDLPGWAGPLLAAQRAPQPPYDKASRAASLGATAMIDISDGLLADLGHIAAASGVLIDVASARLSPGDALRTAASALTGQARTNRGSSPPPAGVLAWVLTGGEDHALAATFPPGTALPSRWTVIGQVKDSPGHPAS